MQTTLRIDDEIFRDAKAEAARRGVTLTRYIEEALQAYTRTAAVGESEDEERDRLMDALLRKTAHFRVGEKPSREEMNAR